MAGLAAEVSRAAATAAQALLFLSRLLARLASRGPGEPASAPFLTRRSRPVRAVRAARRARNTLLPAHRDDRVILVYLFLLMSKVRIR